MALFNWNDSFSVNIKSIDDEHKKLIGMLNEFYDNILSKSNKENVSELVKKMKDYIVVHFSNEEKHLKLHAYPELEEHILEHQTFIDKVNDIETRTKHGLLIPTTELTTFLNNWLRNHIMISDKKFSDFLIQKGVE